MATILISGGNGFIGKHLCQLLTAKGYDVAILSRKFSINSKYKTYLWNPEKNKIDPKAILNVDYIIHLAGENISEKRWSNTRKKQIIDSRVDSAKALFEKCKELNKPLIAFISASAVGYYGAVTSEKIFTETDPPSSDFLAETCILWEKAADNFSELKIRTVKIRTGVVLDSSGGILSKLNLPVKLFLGSGFGNGKQYMPWIHVSDLCAIYLKAIEDSKMTGVYNAVAPQHITNKQFITEVCSALKRPAFLPNIPSFLLKIIFGEMAKMFLKGSRISSEKLINSGFEFKFPSLKKALEDIY